MSVKCPWQKNPFLVMKTWKILIRKWFFHYRKWFCMRLLHLAPGPRTAQRVKNDLLSSRMEIFCKKKGPKVTSACGYDMMSSNRVLQDQKLTKFELKISNQPHQKFV